MDFETEIHNRLIRLEQKVDFLLQELHLIEKEAVVAAAASDPTLKEVRSLLEQGQKIQAIAFYARQKNVSVKEAKRIVEGYM